MRELNMQEVESVNGGDGSFTVTFGSSAACGAAAATGAYFGSFLGAPVIGAGTGYLLAGCVSFN